MIGRLAIELLITDIPCKYHKTISLTMSNMFFEINNIQDLSILNYQIVKKTRI